MTLSHCEVESTIRTWIVVPQVSNLAISSNVPNSPRVLVQGKAVGSVLLKQGLIIGRGRDCDVQVSDPGVSRQQARIEHGTTGGWCIVNLASQSGTRVNGKVFREHRLVYGDLIQMGAIGLRFDGQVLIPSSLTCGVEVEAKEIFKQAGVRYILRGISLTIEPGIFVGILGTSGAGKSTLLDILSGIRKASTGSIRIGREDVRQFLKGRPGSLGYVPQDDIIHADLTVEDALRFCAHLRLQRGVPAQEVSSLVEQTMQTLGLMERRSVKIARLSGGQRKRVSIAAEILTKPPILFLDEPSSGLDPSSESKLMELLRDLANGGCTVICTTHVMENVFLFDRLTVVTAGRLVYYGPVAAAREHFGITNFKDLYDTLESEPAEGWEQRFQETGVTPAPPKTSSGEPFLADPAKRRAPRYFQLLMQRQWAILTSEPKNLWLLLGQPLLLGALVAWMGDNVELKLFLGYLSTLWFGCSNAGQEIVKELPIYRRERLAGLPRWSYLLSKFLFWGIATTLQAIVLYAMIHLGKCPLSGNALWQWAAFAGAAWTSVALGTALSAMVKSTTQAVMLVPLLLLPQIVFSGFVLARLADDPVRRRVSTFMPSYSAQQIMDLSLFWNQRTVPSLREEHPRAINALDRENKITVGGVFNDPSPGKNALLRMVATIVFSILVTWGALASKERNA